MDIRHVVVLMLENRSFDGMLGMLYPHGPGFNGLAGTEHNTWHKPDGSRQTIAAWTDPTLTPQSLCIPNPDPGELFTDIQMQLHGLDDDGMLNAGPTMDGFVDNYMRQPATSPAADPYAPMHYFTPNHVPVISQLARAFGVSDTWHASAPCQTWPNRFFVHTGTANGYVNNAPTHFPYDMPTVFNRLGDAGQSWRIYFHDIPQTATLSQLWPYATTHFSDFHGDFPADAAAGRLPAYSFIEPRYFTGVLFDTMPNDEHPPHNVAYGEQLIAAVYNAVRSGPGWPNTLLVITYDEHGGCYDHVVPPPATPPATPPGGAMPDGFRFDYFGVRVPAVIVSPYVRPGSVIRPAGDTPFDHSSIIATLRRLFHIAPLTARDAAAPHLLDARDVSASEQSAALQDAPTNNGPDSISAPAVPPAVPSVAIAAARTPNNMQQGLAAAAQLLPTAGANAAAHVARLRQAPDVVPLHPTVGDAAIAVTAHMNAFLGRS
jgi:phospholipase C